MKFKTKSKSKKILKIVGIIAVVALVSAMAASLVSNMRDTNPDNLIKVNETYIQSQKTNYGLEVTVEDDGTIKLKGDTSANEELIVQTLTLPAGTYTISGIEKVNLAKMTLCAKWGGGNVANAGTGNATFTLDAETEVTVSLIIEGSEDGESNIEWANRTIRPVIVEGTEEGKFYA